MESCERLEDLREGGCDGCRKHKNGGGDCGPVRIVAAGHAALCHARHFVAAVHGVFGIRGRLRLVMRVNRALGAGGATGLRIGRPGGCTERCVEDDDRSETERCEKRTQPVFVPKSHFHPKLPKADRNSAEIIPDRANGTDIPKKGKN
jgi:hypothetical protein